METPDVPVNEKKANPTMFFVMAGLQAIPLLLGTLDWDAFMALLWFILGINAWKGREITQFLLNQFPAKSRKSIYYLTNVLISIISFAVMVFVILNELEIYQNNKSTSSLEHFFTI